MDERNVFLWIILQGVSVALLLASNTCIEENLKVLHNGHHKATIMVIMYRFTNIFDTSDESRTSRQIK